MSSREPLWYCYQCHAEMRPLMMPDPRCASCRSDFVEKMENPSDNPREFGHDPLEDAFGRGGAGSPDNFLGALSALLSGLPGPRSPGSPGSPGSSDTSPFGRGFVFSSHGPNRRIQIQVGGPGTGQRRPVVVGGSDDGNSDNPPLMSEFMRRGPAESDREDRIITGPMMAQYLMMLMGHRAAGGTRGNDPFTALFGLGGDGPEPSGRWGDYVFGQEALDRIMTQLMENANAHRPVPATEEIINNLPKDILEEGSPLLEKDCAVCKEQFSLQTEDPDEQVVVTLPCKHPFHEPCIIPWLKSSGTCPVCRYALIEQPDQHPPASGSIPSSGSGSRPSSPPGRSQSPNSSNRSTGSGLFSTLFSGDRHDSSNPSGSPSQSSNPQSSTRPPTHNPSNSSGGGQHVPGGWGDELD